MESRKQSTGMMLTVMGTALAVAGAAATWAVKEIDTPAGIPPIVSIPQKVTGFGLKLGWLKVGWAVVICAVACSALLMIPHRAVETGTLRGLRIALASVVLALAALHAGLFPGVLLAAAGGILLMCGGLLTTRGT